MRLMTIFILAAICAIPARAQTLPNSAPTQPTMNFDVNDDRRTVTVTFPPASPVTYGVEQVNELIDAIGRVRAILWPPYADDFATGQKNIQAVSDPSLVSERSTSGNSLIHIRDPRYGWLHYAFSPENARRLADALQQQANPARPPK